MSIVNHETPVKPSLHDRLMGRGRTQDGVYTADRLRRDILRDVQNLLNTRTPFVPSLNYHYPAAAQSILTYGRPELALLSIDQDLADFSLKIKEAILRFDGRFQHVEIELLNKPTTLDRTLRLRIRAKLRLQQVDRLNFDSEMDFGSGHFQLKRIP